MISTVSSEQLRRIERRLNLLYDGNTRRLMERFYMMIGRYGVGEVDGPAEVRLWDEKDAVLITYADSIQNKENGSPLAALDAFATRKLKGAFKTIHLLPFFPWSSDDGFSVIDYRKVDPSNGTWEDIRHLGQSFDLAFDLVLNHCSAKSSWFKDFIAGIEPARHYFLEMDPSADYTAVVRPRTSPLLTETRTRDGSAHIWTTFSPDQVDLDWSNPEVLFEFIDILMQYISVGMRIARLDAVAFLWKEAGTNCIHLAKTHEVVKLLRDIIEVIAPGTLLLSETNVPHAENISYFGEGDEAHMVYQFSLPPLLLHGLLTGNATFLTQWTESLHPPPPGCTFFNFTASHDGVGLRPLEGILPKPEKAKLVKAVQKADGKVSWRSLPDGSKDAYELNVSYYSALSQGLPAKTGLRRFICSQALMLSLRGIPGMYVHSLLATPNDLQGVKESGINRRINRHKWDKAELDQHLRKSAGKTVMRTLVRMLQHRSAHPAFHPDGEQAVLQLGPSIFGIIRTAVDGSEKIVCLFNFTADDQVVDRKSCTGLRSSKEVFDALAGRTVPINKGIHLPAYEALWLVVPV